VNLCKNCKYFYWFVDTAPICKHPEAIASQEPVFGVETYRTCIVMRSYSDPGCSKEGKYYDEHKG
jgi:hypothetical protein